MADFLIILWAIGKLYGSGGAYYESWGDAIGNASTLLPLGG